MFHLKFPQESIPNPGTVFVDHQKNGRSGHLSHALVEYAPGCVLAFYSNCSGHRNRGHNGFGWIEYKRSTDWAQTWSEPIMLDYSREAFFNEPFTVSCEKAVSPAENTIVLFATRCINPNGWEPYLEPAWLKSTDGGKTWAYKGLLCDRPGRIYDALYINGVIYVLELAKNDFLITDPKDRYYIYESTDGGETFTQRGELPGNLFGRAYGSMELTPDGSLICYTYNAADEYHMDYFISPDFGRTWTERGTSYCAKRIRNPQVAKVRGGYVLHGRAGCMSSELPMHFVLYTSEDGIHWDDGVYLYEDSNGTAYYSNNLVLNRDGRQFVLIQSSVSYKEGQTNIHHWLPEVLA